MTTKKSSKKVDDVPETSIAPVEPIDEKLIGQDAPLTAQIYGTTITMDADPTIVLPEFTGQVQGVEDPLQRFINMYQPGELVMRANFRKHLLTVLEDWRTKPR